MTNEDRDDPQPGLSELVTAAARKSSFGHVTPGEAPTAHALLGAIGGIRGLIESILPGLGFLIVFTITHQVLPSVLVPLALAVIFIVVRLVTRQPVTSAIAGALGIGVSAILALVTGRAEDNFVPGFIINIVMVVVMLGSIAVRRPLIGVLTGFLVGDQDLAPGPGEGACRVHRDGAVGVVTRVAARGGDSVVSGPLRGWSRRGETRDGRAALRHPVVGDLAVDPLGVDAGFD